MGTHYPSALQIRMTCEMFFLMLMVCVSRAQQDTYSYHAAPPSYLPTEPPYLPTEPPYHAPYHGGGGYRHGSSNNELATAIAHLASDLRAFMEEQERRYGMLANQIEDLVAGQKELLHGEYPRGTRGIDDYQPPWEAFTVVPPVYPTEPPTPTPTYDSPLPPSDDYFTPLSLTRQVQDYSTKDSSTEDSSDRKPWRAYKGPRKVQYALPGELPDRKTVRDDILPGYSGEQSPDNYPTISSGYPTHPPRIVSNYGEKPTPPPRYPTEPVYTITAFPPPPPTEVVYPNRKPVTTPPPPPEPYPTAEGSPMHEYLEEY